ncbi:Hypothetical protein NTJ_08068 [Nesidiocoris tenuis]|uniref:Uncharacterized protein n=1 Tax=Nesidiocoris tenuis TaxID=355587 RepID=A0ABN7AST3_9HEMI|nr:Hypothetical protein NTJ_08068 [Nesidiocoris tenuis]
MAGIGRTDSKRSGTGDHRGQDIRDASAARGCTRHHQRRHANLRPPFFHADSPTTNAALSPRHRLKLGGAVSL